MNNCGLYIHIPFCKSKCIYCDFNSYKVEGQDTDFYVSSLLHEIESYKSHTENSYLDTIYIGGGTPSILHPKKIEEILNMVVRTFKMTVGCEITLEINPGTVTLESLRTYKRIGIDRLSIGLQTMDDKLLKKIGRIHDLTEFLECYTGARISGFENINIDLMFALPGQSLKKWEKTIDKTIILSPEHISAYSLQIEEGTKMYDLYQNHTYKSTNEILERKMYAVLKEKLAAAGYIHYEISNFAKENKESRHNLKYWDLSDYIGVGAGAHSYYNNIRYENPKEVNEYCKIADIIVEKNLLKRPMCRAESMSEFMFLGLRKINGISFDDFKERFGIDINEVYKSQIDKMIKLRTAILTPQGIKLTDYGVDVSNSVLCEFI